MTDTPATDPVRLPVDSLRDAIPYLRRPFTPEAVKWKVQNFRGQRAVIVAYIDARLVIERLNAVVPHLWSEHYEPYGPATRCFLDIDGVTREDVGMPQGLGAEKSAVSDALKRAAVKFGVGVSVYALAMVEIAKGPYLETWTKQVQGKEKLQGKLTPAGVEWLKGKYGLWLDAPSKGQQFGAPLDHGDQENAQGVEAEDITATTGDTATTHDFPPEVEAVLVRASEAGHDALANREAAALATGGQPPDVIAAWVAGAHQELDAHTPPDAEVVHPELEGIAEAGLRLGEIADEIAAATDEDDQDRLGQLLIERDILRAVMAGEADDSAVTS